MRRVLSMTATFALAAAIALAAFVIGRGTAVNDQALREFIDRAQPLVGPGGEVANLAERLDDMRRLMDETTSDLRTIRESLAQHQEVITRQAEQLKTGATTLEAAQADIASLREATLRRGHLATNLQGRVEAIEGQDGEARLAGLGNKIAALDVASRQHTYKLSAIDATLRQVASMQRLQLPAGQGGASAPSRATTDPAAVRAVAQDAPPRLPFGVVAIDADTDGPIVTVAEPALAGRRRTAHLAPGEAHLGWSVSAISGRTVIFKHGASGQIERAEVGG